MSKRRDYPTSAAVAVKAAMSTNAIQESTSTRRLSRKQITQLEDSFTLGYINGTFTARQVHMLIQMKDIEADQLGDYRFCPAICPKCQQVYEKFQGKQEDYEFIVKCGRERGGWGGPSLVHFCDEAGSL
jgi:hypothetical protein